MTMRNSEWGIRDPESAIRPGRSGARRRRGAIRMGVLIAGLLFATLHGGCVLAPRQPSVPGTTSPPPPPPTVAGSDVKPTVAADVNRSVGENTMFHKSATDRQKFQVHIDFGKVFESQGNPDRALQEYQDALKVAEGRGRGDLNAADEALAHRRIASALDRLGQFRQSEPHYQKARKLAPKDPKVWNDAGYSYYLQGRWDDAERSLRTALKLAPGDARVRTNLGMALAAAGKTDEALSLLSINEGDAIGHANLGYLLASTGKYDRARQEYQTALTMRPDLPLAQRALVQLDRQERGIAAQPTIAIAGNAPPPAAGRSGRVDPEVIRTSGTAGDMILPPPLPPLAPTESSSPGLP